MEQCKCAPENAIMSPGFMTIGTAFVDDGGAAHCGNIGYSVNRHPEYAASAPNGSIHH
jgi:hypothetical protein